MIGVLLVTHGEMAPGMMNALSLIMGEQSNYRMLGLFHGDDIMSFQNKIDGAVDDLDQGEGVLILVDLFSASPYNQAAMVLGRNRERQIRLISGVNLPMVIEAFNQQMIDSDLDAAYRTVMETGREGIKEFIEELEKYMA